MLNSNLGHAIVVNHAFHQILKIFICILHSTFKGTTSLIRLPLTILFKFIGKVSKSQDRCILNILHNFSQSSIFFKTSHIQPVYLSFTTELQLRVRGYELRFEPRSATQLLRLQMLFKLLESEQVNMRHMCLMLITNFGKFIFLFLVTQVV